LVFSDVHHDIWDYDMPAQPVLISVTRDGKKIPAVAQVTKMGFVFVLDRLTGKPLFPVEERPVPKSEVPGENAWPTQPFPLKPPPLVRQDFAEQDITDVTPESHKYCVAFFVRCAAEDIHSIQSGPYFSCPCTLGGGNWSGASFDPKAGYLFVNANELGAIGALEPQPNGSPENTGVTASKANMRLLG